ncbi:MAG: ribonuclease J [Acidimicrobiia bacterium]|nr:ribonuclease J [Acidimicrobiia bacterium]
MAQPVTITFLGGLGEIGRNCATLELDGRIVILDCGQMFPDDRSPGMDSVLPDFTYLRDNRDRIEACIATHCHEDHIGGLPYLLAELDVPVYGSPFTLGMVGGKLEAEGLVGDLRAINDGERHQIGPFECDFVPVTHSTPSGLITAFHTPQGVILHSSDFKLDLTPVDGRRTDLSFIGALGHDPGIRLLLCDSTNADVPGQSSSETEVGATLARIITEQVGRRVIVGAFSSHIHRLQQIADAAIAGGRTVVPLGFSMQRNMKLAVDLGMLHIADAHLASADDIEELDPSRTCVICTGSQGEPRSALTLMGSGENRWISVGPDDTVIFSSHPIPGNEAAVSRTRSALTRRGVRVVHSGQVDIHTTGHGKQHELKTLHSVADPEWFVPVHGEYEHLVAHVGLARELRMPDDHIVLCEDGDQIVLADDGVAKVGSVPGGHVYVHGIVGHLGDPVLSERLILGQEGFVAVYVVIDPDRRALLAPPRVISRGWIDETGELLLDEAERRCGDAITGALADGVTDPDEFERLVRRAVGKYVNEVTGRRPMIVPCVDLVGGRGPSAG